MSNKPETNKNAEEMRHKILTIIGIILCVVLTPILIINCIMIIQSIINEDEVPGIGGLSPLIVLTESMDDTIKAGDIIITKSIEGSDVEIEDVISYFDSVGNGTSVVTHRVIDIEDREGTLYFQTKGDNNNTPDNVWVSENNLVGEWTGIRIPLVGHVALFMQTTGGLIVCVLVPLGLLIGYEVLRRRKVDKSKQEDVEALMQELQALKAAQAAGNATDGHCERSEAIPNNEVNEPTSCHCERSEAIPNNEVNEPTSCHCEQSEAIPNNEVNENK